MNKFDKALMECAIVWAKQSYCVKGQVGAVIADDSRIVATGYNGTVTGMPNICELEIECTDCLGEGYFQFKNTHKCNKCNGTGSILKTSEYTVHAEQNVISFCAKKGIPIEGLTIYVTLSPCSLCAKLIVQSGIKRVVYLTEYKDLGGIKFLKDCGVIVEKYGELK